LQPLTTEEYYTVKTKSKANNEPSAEATYRPANDSGAAGQSGDTQGLSNTEDVDSESVRELAEEGQSYEAAAVSGVEDAPDPDTAEVTTKQVPEDDVPEEYLNQD
jgi:hypothetical protein